MPEKQLATQPQSPMELATRAVDEGKLDAAQMPAVLRELFALELDYKANRARESFATAFAAFQAECPPVGKSDTVRLKGGSYDFAPLDHVMRCVQPHLTKHGLTVSFDVSAIEGGFIATCLVQHGTHTERRSVPVIVPREMSVNSTQKMGAALTYAKRYALCAALNIVVTNEDDDAQSVTTDVPTITQEQAAALDDLVQLGEFDRAQVLPFYHVKKWAELRADRYEAVKEQLERKCAAKGKAP